VIRTGPCERGVIVSTAPVEDVCPKFCKPWVLAATILGSSMVSIDGSALSVALPVIQRDLAVPLSTVLWVVNAYSLGLAALMLLGGSAGDRYGRRRVFVVGIVLFTIMSVISGVSISASQLIAARALQGLGGALLVPANLAIIGALFDERERGKAIGTWAAFAAVTGALGPVLGGWLVDTISWRALFFLNPPIALVTLFITWRYMPETRNPEAPNKLDWPGAVLVTAALGALALGLTGAGNAGWTHPLVVAALVAALCLLIGFVRTESLRPSPLVPLGLFRSRNFTGANLLTLFLYAALAGVFFLLPFNLIQVQKFAATTTGAVFLPVTIIIAGLSRWSGALQDRIGARWPLVMGPVITAIGFALLARSGADGSYWTDFFPPMVVIGLGMSAVVSPLTTTVMNSVPETQTGIASGINNSVEEVSSLLAVALFGTVALALFQQALTANLLLAGLDPSSETARAGELITKTLMASPIPSFVHGADRVQLEAAVSGALLDGFRAMMLAAAALALFSALFAALMIGRTSAAGATPGEAPRRNSSKDGA
jgi:EmrB/QacA subfamily drug resistance transporter